MGQRFVGENPFIDNMLRGLRGMQYRTGALQSASFTASDLTPLNGTELIVCYDNTGTTPGNLQCRTAAQMYADTPGASPDMTYFLLIRNSSSMANTATVTTATGVTLTGTMTIAQNVTRLFAVTFASNTACTLQSMGILAAGA